jgi:hypothetical protein
VKKQKLDLDPIGGEKLSALISKVYATPKAVARISALMK